MEEVRIWRLTNDKPYAWALMPQVLAKVEKFCAEYETDLKFSFLRQVMLTEFGKENSDMCLLVAVQGKKVVGYKLVLMEVWSGTKFAVIHQYQTDKDVPLPIEELSKWVAFVGGWAKEKGAQDIRAFAVSPELARMYQTFYGFKVKYTLVTRSL